MTRDRVLFAGAVAVTWLTIAMLPEAVDRQPLGSVTGRVTYVGKLPEPIYVFESGSSQSVIAVDAQKGVSSAVVYLHAPPEPAVDGAQEVVVNQRNWWFTPGVVAVRAGQPVRFTNDDPANHNVRATHGAPANRFSAYTGTGEPYLHRFRTNPELAPTVVTCDIHAWMMAWVYVFDHAHVAISGRSGDFALRDVAAGRHRLSVRHGPSGLSRDIEVVVGANRDTHVEVAFDTVDLNLPTR